MKRADQRKIHYIYKISRFDGKYYIGLHSTDNLEDGYFGSGTLLASSLKKHGKDKHFKEILEHLPSREALKLREKEIVNGELLGDKRCMNLCLGGGGGWDYVNKGGQPAHLTKEILSRGGKNCLTREMRSKNLDRGKSTITRKKKLGGYNAGLIGKKWKMSDEGRQNRSDSSKGEKNSQFGTCWINNGLEVIKIKKDKLDEYLRKGYLRGRKW